MQQKISACLLLYLSSHKSGERVSSCQQEKEVTVNNKYEAHGEHLRHYRSHRLKALFCHAEKGQISKTLVCH